MTFENSKKILPPLLSAIGFVGIVIGFGSQSLSSLVFYSSVFLAGLLFDLIFEVTKIRQILEKGGKGK